MSNTATYDPQHATVVCPTCGREVARGGHKPGHVRMCILCNTFHRLQDLGLPPVPATLEEFNAGAFRIEPTVHVGGH